MKKYFFVVLLFVSSFGFSQSVNNYKYAIVPSKFSFLNETDQYRLNTLTKLFMEKYGFITYLDTDIQPKEVANENCNKVYVDVLSNGSLFMSKLTVVLKDCSNKIVFKSAEGKSREKVYQKAYNQALREAFNSFEILAYKYIGKSTDSEAATVKTTPENSTINKEVILTTSIVVDSQFDNYQNSTSIAPVSLFAQPIENGFQLIDTTPKMILKIYKTSVDNVFLGAKENLNGIVHQKNENWFFDYYLDGKLITEVFKIKF